MNGKCVSGKLKLGEKISYIFTFEAYDCLNQVPADLQEPTKKWGNVICKD